MLGFVSRYGDLLSSASLTCLNGVVLASRCTTGVVYRAGAVAQLALSTMGLLALPGEKKQIEKSVKDLALARRLSYPCVMVANAVKVANHALTILLIAGNFVLNAAHLLNKKEIVKFCYRFGLPLGLVGMVASIAIDLYTFSSRHFFIREVDKTIKTGNEKPSLKERIQWQIDPWEWEAQGKRQTSLAEAHTYCASRQFVDTAAVALWGIGYAAMAVNRIFPNTVLQAAVNAGISGCYTLKLAYQKAIKIH